MSANSAVTVLRSPWIASECSVIRWTVSPDCDCAGNFPLEAEAGKASAVRCAPHFLQKLASTLLDVAHAGQINSSRRPHPWQNCASAGLSRLHFVHRTTSPTQLLEQRF